MKKQKIRLLFLLIFIILMSLFVGCSKTETMSNTVDDLEKVTKVPTEANGAPIPSSEYDRGVWYGFLPEELMEVDPDNTVVTWKQYCTMLGNMIKCYRSESLSDWEKMTVGAPDTGMKRDDAAIALLYAAKTIDLHYCNRDGNDVYNSSYSWGEHFSWDYPLFDWQNPIQLNGELGEGYDTSNAIAPAYWFLLGKISCITFQPMLELENGDPNLESSLTCRDGIVSVVRLYESVESVTIEVANKMLERVLQTEEGARIVAEAEARKSEILNSETKIIKSDTYIQGETYTGTAYYVSNNGNDAADGKSPETAWATIERLASVKFNFGDIIFFERGGTWRKANIPGSVRYTEGLTLSAYGEGEKPKLIGSPESGTGAEKWTLYYEGQNGEKIWKFYNEMTDCSAIVLNGETTFKRDLAYWNGTEYLCIEDFSVSYSMETQMKDMELFVELPYTEAPIKENDETIAGRLGRAFQFDENGNPLMGPLYVRCDEGNPGELYEEIEFIAAYKPVDGMSNYTTLDNLFFGYSTNTVAGGQFDGVPNDHLIIQNCEACWSGGSLDWFGEQQNAAGFGHVEMAGGGFNVAGSYETIQNCYVHHLFQDGVNLEVFPGESDSYIGSTLRNNVSEYCLFGIGAAMWEEDGDTSRVFKDICIENNYSLYNGFQSFYNYPPLIKNENFGGIHWPSRIGYIILDAAALSATAGGENYKITGNTFAFSVSQLIQHSKMDYPASVDYEGNTYAVLPGFAYSSKLENPWGPIVVDRDAGNAIKNILGDNTATIIEFE